VNAAVTEDINPSCNISGRSGRKALIAYMGVLTSSKRVIRRRRDGPHYPIQHHLLEHILNQSVCLSVENRAGQV